MLFGGPCDLYEATVTQSGTTGAENSQTGEVTEKSMVIYTVDEDDLYKNCTHSSQIQVPFRSQSSVPAAALIYKTCAEILCESENCGSNEQEMENRIYVQNAMNKVCEEDTCDYNSTNKLNALKLFHPYFSSLPEELSEITYIDSSNNAQDINMIAFIFALCVDPTWR